jgi:hypothetical protein
MTDTPNSLYKATHPPTLNQPVTHTSSVNNSLGLDQLSSNPAPTTSNVQHHQTHQMLLQQLPLINPFSHNLSGYSNSNNNINQQPMYHYPYYTSNQAQQTNPSNIISSNQPLETSTVSSPSSIIAARHQHVQNGVIPMESDNGDEFTLVKIKKNKKVKLNTNVTPNTGSSSSSISTS